MTIQQKLINIGGELDQNRIILKNIEIPFYIPSEELVALSIEEMCDDILVKRKNMDKAFETSEKEKLQEDSETVSKIKDFLDSLQELLHRVKPLKVNGVEESSFYANFELLRYQNSFFELPLSLQSYELSFIKTSFYQLIK